MKYIYILAGATEVMMNWQPINKDYKDSIVQVHVC